MKIRLIKSKINLFEAHLQQIKETVHYTQEMKEKLEPIYVGKLRELYIEHARLANEIEVIEPEILS